MPSPLAQFDSEYEQPIIGVDEVGRGPWAGPVVACALCITQEIPTEIALLINDSKKLTHKKRAEVIEKTQKYCKYEIQEATPKEIDELNILQATFLAMERAINTLNIKPNIVLIDGNRAKSSWTFKYKTVIKGDSKSLSIALASIYAKEKRDNIMKEYAKIYTGYGFENHMGYGTPEHIKALANFGITEIHRKSFKPIKPYVK